MVAAGPSTDIIDDIRARDPHKQPQITTSNGACLHIHFWLEIARAICELLLNVWLFCLHVKIIYICIYVYMCVRPWCTLNAGVDHVSQGSERNREKTLPEDPCISSQQPWHKARRRHANSHAPGV